MEYNGEDHQTSTYFSYDTPHRGAWIPISLQAFAHWSKPLNADYSTVINSPAARQMLWRHIENAGDEPAEDPMRTKFLAQLDDIGGWPRRPHKRIGVANGAGNGQGNGDVAGAPAISCTGLGFQNTVLYVQDSDDPQTVASLNTIFGLPQTVQPTRGLPEADGAPGGMLDSFKLLADSLNSAPLSNTEVHFADTCFIPTVSAVAIRDLDANENWYTDVAGLPQSESELDAFQCASRNEGHIFMSQEHGEWLLSQLPN
jgi:hypothetical protein